MSDRRIVSPSLGLLIVLPLTVILASTITFVAFESAGILGEEDPAADVSIDFVETDIGCESEYIVSAKHDGGETIDLRDVEISVRLLGSQRQNDIVNLPLAGDRLEERNIRYSGDLITDCAGGVIVESSGEESSGEESDGDDQPEGDEDGQAEESDDEGASAQVTTGEVPWNEDEEIIFAIDDQSQVFFDDDPTFIVEVVDTSEDVTLAREEIEF